MVKDSEVYSKDWSNDLIKLPWATKLEVCSKCVNKTAHIVVEVYGFKFSAKFL